jgi:hypothetical protein
MTHRLLALIALLTGLAAFATPGNASILDALDCEVGVSASAADSETSDECGCPDSGVDGTKREPGKKAAPNKRMKRVLRPPVLFGVDRAHE